MLFCKNSNEIKKKIQTTILNTKLAAAKNI